MSYQVFWDFSNAYRLIHGWLSTGVCLFGIPCNLLNIIVLTRSNMITSPTNLILTGLAFSDLLTMLSSLVYNFYYYILHGKKQINVPLPDRDTLIWTHFGNLHIMISVTFHSISIWLTVYLACFRYIYLASSSSSVRVGSTLSKSSTNRSSSKKQVFNLYLGRFFVRCRTYNFTFCGIINVCLFCILFCFPAYLYPTVREKIYDSNQTNILNSSNYSSILSAYFITSSDLDVKTNGIIFKLLFYTQAILGKFIPCLLLVTFSSLLIHSLVAINKKNKQLNKISSGLNSSKTSYNLQNAWRKSLKKSKINKAGKKSKNLSKFDTQIKLPKSNQVQINLIEEYDKERDIIDEQFISINEFDDKNQSISDPVENILTNNYNKTILGTQKPKLFDFIVKKKRFR